MYQSVAHAFCGGQGPVGGSGHRTLPHEPR
jgi:hypothetical protein